MRAENVRTTVESVACTDRDGWRRVKIGALGRVVTGKTPPTADEENFGGAYPFVTPGDMHQGRCVIVTARYVSDKGALTVKNSRIPKGAVCVSCIGSDMGNVVYTNRESFTNQQINSIICCGDVDSLFVYYLMLTQKDIIKGIGTAGGSAVPIMSKSEFCDLDVALPPFPAQRKIADILGAYDDLIENNRRRIALLERMARELYRERFVRRAKGVCSFHTRSATEWFGEITIGKTPPRKEPTHFIGSVPWVSISDMGREGMFVFDTAEQLAEASVRDLHIKVVPANTLLLSFKLTVGRLSITTVDCCTNEAIAHLNVGERLLPYMYLYLQDYEYAKLGNTCAISDGINSKIVKNMPIAIPSNDLELEQFNAVVTPMFDEMLLLARKNRNLVQQRDRLLPRLMSGKIDLEKFVQGEEVDNG